MKKILLIVAAFFAVICCSEPKEAKASTNNPTLGGCIVKRPVGNALDPNAFECMLSAHPSVVQPLAAIDLKTGDLRYGLEAVSPGVCYGVTYAPNRWYASGGDFCLNVGKTDVGNVVFPSGIAHFVKWGQVGLGGLCSDGLNPTGNGLKCHALLMFGANIPIE